MFVLYVPTLVYSYGNSGAFSLLNLLGGNSDLCFRMLVLGIGVVQRAIGSQLHMGCHKRMSTVKWKWKVGSEEKETILSRSSQ